MKPYLYSPRLFLTLALFAALAIACSSDEGASGPADVTADGDLAADTLVDGDPADDADTTEPDSATDVSADADVALDAEPDGEPDMGDSTVCPAPRDDLPPVTQTPDDDQPRLVSLGQLVSPGLRDREVRVYLPVGYDDDTEQRYPVLYMHDGQNLFDPTEAAFGQAWEVDRTLDRLLEDGLIAPWILVSLNNTNDRIPEYTPEGLGEDYVDWLVEVVKPVIDANFRTLCGRENTAVAGSSLGGLISVHSGMRYPSVFGRVGAVSPSLWWEDNDMLERATAYQGEWPMRFWIDGGTAEGGDAGGPGLTSMVANTRTLRGLLLEDGLTIGDEIGYLEILDGNHNETAWADRLDTILAFLLTDEVWVPESAERLSAWAGADTLRVGAGQQTTLLVDAVLDATRRLTLPNDSLTIELDPAGVVSLGADGWLTAAAPGEVSVDVALGELGTRFTFPVLGSSDAALTFLVFVPSATPSDDPIYVATDFLTPGEWSPDAVAMRNVRDRLWRAYVVGDDGAPIEFKFTRGTWETVEKNNLGAEIANRTDAVDDSRAVVFVQRWADTPD